MPTETKDTIPLKKLDAQAVLPTRAHADDAGLDLYGLEKVTVKPGEMAFVKTGVALAVPAGHVGLVADRSSLGKLGLKTAGGVIDAGYRGELRVMLWNISKRTHTLEHGDRIAQLLIVPIATPAPVEVDALDATERGTDGFGSTGS